MQHTEYHKDGTILARGYTLNGLPTDYWEWFRRDGTRMRSGHFPQGVQVGEWTAYGRDGQATKVTVMKTKMRRG